MNLAAKVEQIYVKVQNLLLLQRELKVQNDKLSADNARLLKVVEDNKVRIRELEERIKLLRLAKTLTSQDQNKHDLKLKLNEMIREVDKSLALLNN